MKKNTLTQILCITATMLSAVCQAQEQATGDGTVLMNIGTASGGTGQVLATVTADHGMILSNIVARFGGQDFQIADISSVPFRIDLCRNYPQFPTPRETSGSALPHRQVVVIDTRLVARISSSSNVVKSATCKAN